MLSRTIQNIASNFNNVGAKGCKRLSFCEDAAKVLQQRMVPNFKKSFERAVRTARR
jgi:hypothetical protein